MKFELSKIGSQTFPYPDRQSFINSPLTDSLPEGAITSDGRVLYIRKHDSNAIFDKHGWLPYGDIDPAHFGADYTGLQDSHAAFQAALDYAQGSLVVCGDGILKINHSIVSSFDYQVIDLKNCIIDGSEFSDWTNYGSGEDWNSGRNGAVFEFQGKKGKRVETTESASPNQFFIKVKDTTDIYPGQHIKLFQYANKIRRVDVDTIFLEMHIGREIATGKKFRTWTPIRFARLKGGIIKGGGMGSEKKNGFGQTGVRFEGFEDCFITDCSIQGFQNTAIAPRYGLFFTARDLQIQGHEDTYKDITSNNDTGGDLGFYGIYHHSMRNSFIHNVVGRRTRHLIDGAGTVDVVVSQCTAIRTHAQAYSAHSGTENWTFIRCKCFEDQFGALIWRGYNLTLIDNIFVCPNYSYAIYDKIKWKIDKRIIIKGNIIVSGTTSIILNNNIENLEIIGNHFETAQQATRVMNLNHETIRLVVKDNYVKYYDKDIEPLIFNQVDKVKNVIIKDNITHAM